ncbi:MAG TPA: matrixin family metalloprotease, partial [Vicinamibacterales bacterium]|nr:matrixin family metalloprotease [Vicinamibacterales bacterium]
MMRRAIPLALVLVAAAVGASQSYWANGPSWPSGTVAVQLEFGASPALTDGCVDWSCSAAGAVDRWNLFMGRIQLKAVHNSQHARGELNGRNDLFFATDMYGKAFGHDTLALTTWWYRRDELVEADIGFNQTKRWDSYRGNTRPGLIYDLRRVALHELGHVLGLGHPDDHGQSVVAMMNSTIGNLDSLTTDDIAGIQEIYGSPVSGTGGSTGGGTGGAIGFPPRNETYEFRNWLESKYVNTLGRPAGLSYSDVEGSVVWVQEYLRYRLNLCSHEQAVERVRIQIAGGGVPGVCGTPASTSVIAFPPRDQTYGFRLQLEEFYRVDLARAAVKTSVDAEGDVVWIQEYLRYRLNSCT